MTVDPLVTRRLIESLSTHLEDHLAAWKSSLVDAKREVENVLAVAGEKIPAQARPLFPEDLMGMILEDILPPPPAPQRIVERVVERVEVPVPGAAAPPDWTVVRGAVAGIESARTQVDLLSRFLAQAQTHASRVALLVLRNDRLTGWKAAGYDASGGRDDAAKQIDIAADADPFAAEALRRERSISADPPEESWPIRRALGGRPPARALMVPMVIRDRIAGLLFAEELPDDTGRLNEAAIEVLAFVTGLAVDLLAARKKIPSPTLTPTGEAIPSIRRVARDDGMTLRAPAIQFPEKTPAPMPRLPSEPAAPRPDESEARKKVTDAEQAIRALEESANARRGAAPRPASTAPRPQPTPPAGTGEVTLAFEHLRTPSMPEAAPAAPPPPAPEPAEPRAMPLSAMQEPAAAPAAAPLAPPPGFVPRSRLARGDDHQRALDDAKRLARLLVSEIKLYNERKVEEGRAAGDLYERLKDDIQRSRQVYDERTPESVRNGTDFFRDELVRILGDGRPEALGPMA
jgi:GAF domain-containing protein